MVASTSLLEQLAELEHIQWMAWSKRIAEAEKLSPNASHAGADFWVPYAQLSEEEKEHDRKWARQALSIFSLSPPSASAPASAPAPPRFEILSDGTPAGTSIKVDGDDFRFASFLSFSIGQNAPAILRITADVPMAHITAKEAEFALNLVGDKEKQIEWLKARLYDLQQPDCNE